MISLLCEWIISGWLVCIGIPCADYRLHESYGSYVNLLMVEKNFTIGLLFV